MPRKNYKYKISIILTTYQSFASLCHSLSNILLQNFNEDDYEVIALSHGIPDAVSKRKYPMIYVRNLKIGYIPVNPEMPYQPSFVRNKGIRAAEGKLVFFMHDNVDLAGKDYLKRLWGQSHNGKIAVMTTKTVHKYAKDGTTDKTEVVTGFFAQQDAIPLKYLLEVGGFDEQYDGDSGMDDIDLKKRCELVGCKFYESPDLQSIKHNLRELYPPQKTGTNWDGSRNLEIFTKKGFKTPE